MWEILQTTESVAAIGLLALLVAVVTEFTKDIGWLKHCPTDLQALVSGICFSLAIMLAQNTRNGLGFCWYQAVEAVIRGILASFVAIYGWTKLEALGRRMEKKGVEDEQR